MAACLALFLVLGPADGPAVAQDDPEPTMSTADPATTVHDTTDVIDPGSPGEQDPAKPAETTIPATTTPSSTAPAPTDASTSDTTDGAPDPTIPDGTGSDGTEPTGTSVDPLLDEPQGETVPELDVTVPERTGAYGDQGEFEPARVLWSSVRAAERKLTDAHATHQEAIEGVRATRLDNKALRLHHDALGVEDRQAAAELRQAEADLQERAVAAFVNNEAASTAVVGTLAAAQHDEVLELRSRWVFLEAALGADEEAIAHYLDLRRRLDRDLLTVLDELRESERQLRIDEQAVTEAAAAVAQATDELEAFSAGSAIYIKGVVFPVAQPYDAPLIDSWGFPRMPGTPDEHWHEGIDIFAPAGTPLVAAERGVIARIGNGRLGGLSLWLRGESGADWYYAHLLDFAPDLHLGQVVEAGQLVGHVGNTGNAATTPAHLHLQLHPGGGDPVNPYPLLNVVSARDLAMEP